MTGRFSFAESARRDPVAAAAADRIAETAPPIPPEVRAQVRAAFASARVSRPSAPAAA